MASANTSALNWHQLDLGTDRSGTANLIQGFQIQLPVATIFWIFLKHGTSDAALKGSP